MTNLTSQSISDVWRLEGVKATLCTPELTASLDLLNPQLGLTELSYQGSQTTGFVLGVKPSVAAPLSKQDVTDAYVRGNDLVVTYAETPQRPYSLQVYWRATVGSDDTLLLNTILSLQTDLLESFPDVAVTTQLPAAAAYRLLVGKSPSSEVLDNLPQTWTETDSDAVLLKSTDSAWSYAEMTHPEDLGTTTLDRVPNEAFTLDRQLGGRFLEKGVIRRLRVRGVFLPQANDLAMAAACLANMVEEVPPLTV